MTLRDVTEARQARDVERLVEIREAAIVADDWQLAAEAAVAIRWGARFSGIDVATEARHQEEERDRRATGNLDTTGRLPAPPAIPAGVRAVTPLTPRPTKKG